MSIASRCSIQKVAISRCLLKALNMQSTTFQSTTNARSTTFLSKDSTTNGRSTTNATLQ